MLKARPVITHLATALLVAVPMLWLTKTQMKLDADRRVAAVQAKADSCGEELVRLREAHRPQPTMDAPKPSGATHTADDPRARLAALFAKGRSPQEAEAAADDLVIWLQAHALDVERVTRKRVVGDDGAYVDLNDTALDLFRLMQRKFGRDREAMRRAAIYSYGPRLGTALLQLGGDAK
jgi:hypothetical protein